MNDGTVLKVTKDVSDSAIPYEPHRKSKPSLVIP